MVFYKLSEVPIRGDDKVFKASPVGHSIWLILVLVIAAAALVIGIRGGIPARGNFNGIPPSFAYLGAGTLSFIGLFLIGPLKASFKPTNWLLRCSSGGVIIKYRSYLNWRLPADDVVAVGFDYSEIAWARKTRERRESPSLDINGNGTEFTCRTYLDFCLKDADTTELRKNLDAERQHKYNTLYLDYPVEMIDDAIVRIRWRGIIDYLSPGNGEAIEYLGRFIKVAPKDSEKLDLTHNYKANPSDEDIKILKLVKSGDKIAAAELTRQIYGCSLAEAVKFVEKLQSGEIRHGSGYFELK
jgi:hypothetical protein